MGNISICLVAILKGEENFIDEWLVYHRMIGIDHFFLYDDDPEQPLEDYLLPHSEYVSTIPWRLSDKAETRRGNQLAAYNHALNNHIKKFEWVVFLDGDEFIVLRKHQSIKEFLSGFKNHVSVSLNWHLFGHNGFYYDPDRLITSSLTRRMLMPFPDVKTITKTAAIGNVSTPHYCSLKYGERADANGRPHTDEIYEGKTEVANINHYHCRSFKNWMGRVERGHINYNPTQSPDPQKWRFDEELCLKRFVNMIARDKNEHTDEFMLQYRFDILENMNKLKRREEALLKEYLTTKQKTAIRNQLSLIAETLIAKANSTDNIGLLNGRSGIAVFLFHYSRFTDDPQYNHIAFRLLDELVDEITEDSPVTISNGLAGYGIAIEHLVSNSFIKIDTDDELKDIDILMNYYRVTQSLSDPDFNKNIRDVTRYYLSRFNNPINAPYYNKDGKSRRDLEDILPLMPLPTTVLERLSLLDLMTEAYTHRDNRSQAIEDIQLEISGIDKIMGANVDRLTDSFNFLHLAEILCKVSEKTNDEFYRNRAHEILSRYENEYWQRISQADFAETGTDLRCLYLGRNFNKPDFITKRLNNLTFDKTEDTSDLKAIIGQGLSLLILSEWNEHLYNLALLFQSTGNISINPS